MLPQFQALSGYTAHIHYSDDESEYIFLPADILAMDGSINAEKRRSLRKCAGLTGISLVPAANENALRIMDIEESWCHDRDCAVCASFCGCEKKALAIMLNIFDKRIHQGLILYRNGEPTGYAVGDRQNNCAQLYYGKALLPDFFVYLIHAMAAHCFSDAVSFNMGEDMGNPGLRFFKRRLGNHTQWRRYICDLSLER